MKFNVKIAAVSTTIFFLLLYLLVAIFRPLDGIGILALCALIFFFSLLLLKEPKKVKPDNPVDDSGDGVDRVGRNAAEFIEFAESPKFLGALFSIFLSIISYIESHLDQLSGEQLEILNQRLNRILNKLNQKPTEPRPTLSGKRYRNNG